MDNGRPQENGVLKGDANKLQNNQVPIPEKPSIRHIMAVINQRDAAVLEKNLAFSERKAALAERDMAILMRDTAFAERDKAVEERNQVLQMLESVTSPGVDDNQKQEENQNV